MGDSPAIPVALRGYTGFLLSRMGMVAMRRFSERLEPLALTTRLWGVLNVLAAQPGLSQQALGAEVAMDPSSVVAAIDELERQGRVERRRDPSDRRAYALYLTDEGDRTLARGRVLAREAHDELLAPLGEDERRLLHDLLLRLAVGAAVEQPVRGS
jgi:DNA-binding MarR family transcriptional regulator